MEGIDQGAQWERAAVAKDRTPEEREMDDENLRAAIWYAANMHLCWPVGTQLDMDAAAEMCAEGADIGLPAARRMLEYSTGKPPSGAVIKEALGRFGFADD